jgi:hypothetical protein
MKEINMDTEMQKTLTSGRFEPPGLIAAPAPAKGSRAARPWTAEQPEPTGGPPVPLWPEPTGGLKTRGTGGFLGFSKRPYYFFVENDKNRPRPLRLVHAD